MISFDELDLMMQQKNGASQPETPSHARTDFLDYMNQVTNNSTGYAGNAHADSNTELKPLSNFELSRVAAPNFDDGAIENQPYEIQNMDMNLGTGGQLPDSFEVRLRPQYELDSYA